MFKKIAFSATMGIILSSAIFMVITIVPWSEFTSPPLDEAPSSPMTINLYVSPFTEPQGLGSEANLKIEIASIEDASNVTAKINLPEGLSLVSGNLTWNGTLQANVSSSFDARIKATKLGNWTISATVKWYLYEDSWVGAIDRATICVFEDRIIVTPASPMGESSSDAVPSGYDELKKESPH